VKPYALRSDLRRFRACETAFRRARRHAADPAHGKRTRSSNETIALGKPGCGREDFALHAASREVQRRLAYAAAESAAERHQPEDRDAFTRRGKGACPAGAVPDGGGTFVGPSRWNNPGALKWHVHADRCLAFRRVNGVGCANGIAACPFSGPASP